MGATVIKALVIFIIGLLLIPFINNVIETIGVAEMYEGLLWEGIVEFLPVVYVLFVIILPIAIVGVAKIRMERRE